MTSQPPLMPLPVRDAPTDVLTGAAAPLRRAAGARLPARLTELQRALIWSEILGPPVSLRENGRR